MPLPIAIEFLSPDDPNRFFLLEKHTGKVQLVENGVIADLLAVLFAFGSSDSAADLNNDGVVDDADLLTVLFNFGSTGG